MDRTLGERPCPTALGATAVAVLALAGCGLGGCRAMVAALRMVNGDPQIPAQFRMQTGVNLPRSGKTMLVVCSASESTRAAMPSLVFDLNDGLLRELKRHGIATVNPRQVSRWIDEHGGAGSSLSELAKAFQTDYIAQVDVDSFTWRESNSSTLWRGRASGTVTVHEVSRHGGSPVVRQVFPTGFQLEYPRLQPVTSESVAEHVFQSRFLNELSCHLARFFHDSRPGEEF